MSLRSRFRRKPKKVFKTPKVLYHGSPHSIKGKIKPGSFGRVSASPDRSIAIMHSAKGMSDLRRIQVMYKGLRGRKRHEIRLSKQDIKNLKKPGWIYVVNPKGFQPALAWTEKQEWALRGKSVEILKKIRAPSLYDYIKKNPGKFEIWHKRGPLARWALLVFGIGPFIATNVPIKDMDEYFKKK